MTFLAPALLPPANLEAEQALLGALLANNKAYERVAGFLRAEHFADQDVHAHIYAAIQRRIEAGQLADAVTLRAEFENSGLLAEVGGTAYFGQLLSAMVGVINAGEYGRVVEDAWLRRQMLDVAADMHAGAFGAMIDKDARGIIEDAEARLSLLAENRGGGVRSSADVVRAAMDGMMSAIDRRGGLAGVTSGFRAIDRMTGGFTTGQYVLIGARPSMGKTSLATGIALGAAKAGQRVLFISAEMDSAQIMARALACDARVPLSAVLRGLVDDEGGVRVLDRAAPEVAQIANAGVQLGALPIVWDDQCFTVSAIRASARRMQREKAGLGLVVVDYLGLLRATSDAAKRGRVEAVSEISADFKRMARVLGVPVVVLSQLSRALETRDDKMPTLSDLRDSGSLEQDADVVLFLHREHHYLVKQEPRRGPKEKAEAFEERVRTWMSDMARERGRATVMIAKQRQGPIGPVRLRFHDATTRFSDEGED